MIFVDTNVLVYARDASEPDRQARAAEWMQFLWQMRLGRLSVQVLQEYYVAVTRKLKPGLAASAARADVRALEAWDPVKSDAPLMETAWAIEERYKLSFWDSMIVSAASRSGATHLLTEDLQHERKIEGVVITNPFKSSPAEVETT